MATRITPIVPLLFITLFCVALVEGGYQLLEHFVLQPVPTAEPQVSKAAPSTIAGRAEQPVKHDYRIILKRNLFGPPPGDETKGIVETKKDPDELEATSLNIVLMGTISGTEGTHRAIILDKKNHEQELYETGDAIQGALVKEILRGKVILALNGKDEILDMSEAAKMRSRYRAKNAARAKKVKRPVRRVNQQPPVSVAPSGDIDNSQPAAVSPRGTPRRIINRPRVVRPSRPTTE